MVTGSALCKLSINDFNSSLASLSASEVVASSVYACSKAVDNGPYTKAIALVVGAGVATFVCSKKPEITSSLRISWSLSNDECVGIV